MDELSFKNLLPFTFFTAEGYRYVKLPNIPAIVKETGADLFLNAYSFDYQCYLIIKEEIICQPLPVYPTEIHPYNDRVYLN